MDGWMGRWMNEWMEGCMTGLTGGWIHVWMREVLLGGAVLTTSLLQTLLGHLPPT